MGFGSNALAASRNDNGANKPVCAARAICFSGEISAGGEFRKAIDDQLDFVLGPEEIGGQGWRIQVLTRHGEGECGEFAHVVTGPLRGHSDLDIDMSYGISAEDEASSSPRKFSFVTNCPDYRVELDRLRILLWPYTFTEKEVNKAQADLGSSPLGEGRLWITDSKISHASDTSDNKLGTIAWIRFTVEILLPKSTSHSSAAKAK